MRILMLAQCYPPMTGREAIYVRNLSVALAQRGHEVAVATMWHGGLPDVEVCDGVRIYRIRGLVQHIPGLYSNAGRQRAAEFRASAVVPCIENVYAECLERTEQRYIS